MRQLSALFIIFSLILFASRNDARKDPGEYWKRVMDGAPMPKAITDYFYQHPANSNNEKQREQPSDDVINMDHFVMDFGTKPNLIIYHSHVDTQVVEQLAKGVEHAKEVLSVPEV